MKTCPSCIYHEAGTCHRYPPQYTATLAVFPHVAPHHWCGEYQERKDGVIDISDRAWRTKKERRPG